MTFEQKIDEYMILEKIERRPKVKAFGDIGPFRGQAAG
jgi:hypothetical protein